MRLLLDTHVFIWAASMPARLSAAVRAALADESNEIAISTASAWEITIKQALGKLQFPVRQLIPTMEAMRLMPLPIMLEHAIAAGSLPRHHNDPFDRMIVAQAIVEQLTLVTDDRRIRHYDVPVFGGS